MAVWLEGESGSELAGERPGNTVLEGLMKPRGLSKPVPASETLTS
jgi:hypothetical protein